MIHYQGFIRRADLRSNPYTLYVFGDNVAKVGFGGQAAQMRGEKNAVGIPTKWSPHEFFNEDSVNQQRVAIFEAMQELFVAARNGRCIVLPLDGVGTGRAELQARSPRTWDYLQMELDRLIAEANA